MKVEVTSKEIIMPSIPTPRNLNHHNLSLLDQANGQCLVPLIFFYSSTPSFGHENVENNLKIGVNSMLSRLKESLAATLTKFYPLAGRIKDGNIVVCSDEGVPYANSRVDMALVDVVNKVQVSELDKLLPCKSQGPSKLPLAIQVNLFKCGGLAIGLCFNHRVADAFSLLMFVKTWSIIARGEATGGGFIAPCFDVGGKIFPLAKNTPETEFENEKVVTKRFTFDERSFRSLSTKYKIGNENVSKGLILLAFIYSRIAATSQSVLDAPWEVSRAVNVRTMTNYAQNDCFLFGNVYLNAIAKPSSSVAHKGVNTCVEMIEEMTKATKKIDSKFMEKIQNGTQDMSFLTDHFERAKMGEIVLLGFSNYSGLPVYESDFGWGKPIWVTSATTAFKNVVGMIPNQFGTQADAYVCLSPEDLKNLECDQEFNSFTKKQLSSML